MTRYLCHEFVGGTGSPWSQAPDGLYVVRSGVATALSATELQSLLSIHGYSAAHVIAAVTQAQGGAE